MGYTGKKPTNVVDVSETQSLTVDGDLTIADKIVHSGDTNTAIRFADTDTITPVSYTHLTLPTTPYE